METEADLKEERSMAAEVSKSCGHPLKKLPKFYNIDYALMSGYEPDAKVLGFVEMRRRYNDSTKYPTLLLNWQKWRGLVDNANDSHLPAFFAVRFNDGMKIIQADDRVPDLRLDPRAKGERDSGQELVAHIHGDDLQPLETINWVDKIHKSTAQRGL